jgi:hypothetical protein
MILVILIHDIGLYGQRGKVIYEALVIGMLNLYAFNIARALNLAISGKWPIFVYE